MVPVIGFGENELYPRRRCFNLLRNGFPWGRFICGYIPIRHPVTTVGKTNFFFSTKFASQLLLVGKAIHVNRNANATSEDVDRLHRDYIQAVEELFEQNKDKYELGHVELEIV